MNKGLKVLTTILLVAFSFSIVGCSGKPADTKDAAPGKKVKVNFGTGGSGGVYYVIGAGIADAINKKSAKISVTAQSTSASTENLNLISSGQINFAIVTLDTAYFASLGQREYKNKLDNIRLVMLGHLAPYATVVFADSPYKTMGDLNGKKIAVNPGAIGLIYATEAYKPWGAKLPAKTPVLSYAEMANALKDGTIDSFNYCGGHPVSSIMDLAATKPIRLLGQTEETVNKIIKDNPYLAKTTIPANTYAGQDKDLLTFAITNCIVVNKNVPDDVVREFMDIVLKADLSAVHPDAKYYRSDHAGYKNAALVPYHPAAEKYLKEKGIIK
jgi:TRAP transporter TAXI family solute receptor